MAFEGFKEMFSSGESAEDKKFKELAAKKHALEIDYNNVNDHVEKASHAATSADPERLAELKKKIDDIADEMLRMKGRQ